MYLEEEEQKDEKNSLFQTRKNHTNTLEITNCNNGNHNAIITLKKRSEIALLFSKGKWYKEVSVSLVLGKNIFSDCDSEKYRFLITTKGIKKKPEKNRLKRKIREHIRNLYPSMLVSQQKRGKFRDIALIASNPNSSFTELRKEIYALFERASIIVKKTNSIQNTEN